MNTVKVSNSFIPNFDGSELGPTRLQKITDTTLVDKKLQKCGFQKGEFDFSPVVDI